MLGISGGLASMAGHLPHLSVGRVTLGFGGLDAYCRFVGVSVALLLAAALVGWTTPLGEIAPAVSRLLGPLRWIRVPVDEAAVAVALCVRSLPLLVDEMRTLVAARRLRPAPPRPGRSTLQQLLDEPWRCRCGVPANSPKPSRLAVAPASSRPGPAGPGGMTRWP